MKLTWSRLDLRLKHPFVTATAHRVAKQTILVCLEHDGIEGWGEAVPADTYGQSLESAERCLAAVQSELGDDPTNVAACIDRLIANFDDQRATVAAIDAALHDWNGKRQNRSTLSMLGLSAERAPLTSVTLGIDSPEKLVEKMNELSTFPIWKIKVGTSSEQNILKLVRGHAPKQIIRVDANTAWPPDEALDRLRRIAAFNVEFVEQPCNPSDLETLRSLTQARICPILADESCVRPADVTRLAGCVDGINIKLSKCGGIIEARRMIDLARASKMKIMLGCMIESSLGIAAAAQLAPLVDWLDLDGHLLLADDPFTGLGGAGGRLNIGNGAGLGVKPRNR